MDVDKKSLPPYPATEKVPEGRSKKSLLLASYGVGITALLVSFVVFGSVLYVRECNKCGEETEVSLNEVQTFDKFLPGSMEEYVVTDDGPANGTVVVLDFSKSLTSMYVPSQNRCFLIGGIDTSINSPLNGPGQTNLGEELSLQYKLASDYPVLDRTFLPDSLQEPCQDRPIYWLERDDTQGKLREKRDVVIGVVIRTRDVTIVIVVVIME